MHVTVTASLPCYGNTDATPPVHGCHGDYILSIVGKEYDEVGRLCDYNCTLTLQGCYM